MTKNVVLIVSVIHGWVAMRGEPRSHTDGAWNDGREGVEASKTGGRRTRD